MAKERKRKTYPVTPEEFVKAWQAANSVEEVAEQLKMPVDIVVARAANYRAKKVELKKMRKPGRKSLDVDGLNKLIAEIDAASPGKTDEKTRKSKAS